MKFFSNDYELDSSISMDEPDPLVQKMENEIRKLIEHRGIKVIKVSSEYESFIDSIDIELENNKSSKFFIQSEILLFTGCFSAFHISNLIEKKYITFASEHAGVSSINDHRYWVDIGNYNTNIDFDSEHLRMRDEKEGQWLEHPWDWNKNDSKRKKFENTVAITG